jgi:energy-converting hydrogenase Eha subunit A
MDTDGHGFQTAKYAKYTNRISGFILAFSFPPSVAVLLRRTGRIQPLKFSFLHCPLFPTPVRARAHAVRAGQVARVSRVACVPRSRFRRALPAG